MRRQRKGNEMPNTITPKELAVKLDSDPRTVRKFLRSDAGFNATVGKGQRWAIEARQVASLRKRFNAWVAAKSPAEDATPEDA